MKQARALSSMLKLAGFVLGFMAAVNAYGATKITTVAGTGVAGYSGDGGEATAAQLNVPRGVAVDGPGNIYFSEIANNCVRKVDASGKISTLAGTGTAGYSGDGGPATAAQLNGLRGVAVNADGNVYIADKSNNRIRKVDGSGKISTVAGTGTPGFSGDGGPATAAQVDWPLGVAIDPAGNLLILDSGNHRVRKVDVSSGKISTIAGTGVDGHSGDGGPATAAQLTLPVEVITDKNGAIYVAEDYWIRKIDTSGNISTIAGTGVPGYSGDGGPATAAALDLSFGLTVDQDGNLYIADQNNHRIRRVDENGIISTFAGTGKGGYNGDGGAPNATQLKGPSKVVYTPSGNFFIADTGNNRIRLIDVGGPKIVSDLTAHSAVGQAFTYAITATGDVPLTYDATSLPSGLTLSGNVISGTPASQGSFTINIKATNDHGEDVQPLVLTIDPEPGVSSSGTGSTGAGPGISSGTSSSGKVVEDAGGGCSLVPQELTSTIQGRNALIQARTQVQMTIFRSGVIPKECAFLKWSGSPYLVDCWIQHTLNKQNVPVAALITWADHKNSTVTWTQWEDWRKADLRNAYVAATKWYNDGMQNYTGQPVDSVPTNKEEPWVDEKHFTVLDEDSAAWPIYVAHVAFSLAAEINGWVPWSLRDYDNEALLDLLSAFMPQMFVYSADGSNPNAYYQTHFKGYVVLGNVTPTHPIVSLKFLAENHLIGSSSRQTIANVLDWARANLHHYMGPLTGDNDYQFWQYKGSPPLARVLSGTVCTDPSIGSDYGVNRHWTQGCSGTTDFLKWLLHVVNIPTKHVTSCGHTMPYFSGEKAYLSHGDDPYSQFSLGGESADLLLVDSATWQQWTDQGNQDGSCSQIGRRPIELSLTYIPDYVVGEYCADTIAGLDHEHGAVYEIYKELYTVAQLEATDLWTRLAAKVPTSSAYTCAPLKTSP